MSPWRNHIWRVWEGRCINLPRSGHHLRNHPWWCHIDDRMLIERPCHHPTCYCWRKKEESVKYQDKLMLEAAGEKFRNTDRLTITVVSHLLEASVPILKHQWAEKQTETGMSWEHRRKWECKWTKRERGNEKWCDLCHQEWNVMRNDLNTKRQGPHVDKKSRTRRNTFAVVWSLETPFLVLERKSRHFKNKGPNG